LVVILLAIGLWQVLKAAKPLNPAASLAAGQLNGVGRHFELKGSEYLNIAIDSSEEINVFIESAPEMIALEIESVQGSQETQINLSGFEPKTTYHKYQDDYHNHEVFVSDEEGGYSYKQDISQPHLIFIQPRESTKFIRDDITGGDCSLIGSWDSLTKTCVLSADLNETVQIDTSGITLDGNNRKITGTGTGYGVYLPYKNGVTIKNLVIERFYHGIYLYQSSANTIIKNTLFSNGARGIYLEVSGQNLIAENNISKSSVVTYGYGIELAYSNYNTIKDNISTANNNDGLVLDNSHYNNITNNKFVSNNSYGGRIQYSSFNTLANNAFDYNYKGVYLLLSTRNTFSGNTMNSNLVGLYLYDASNNNIISGNTLADNTSRGIYLEGRYWCGWGGCYDYRVRNNQIYNNNFLNNPTQAQVYEGENNLFNQAAPVGGNYWSNWAGPDENHDGFVDNPYAFSGGQDNLPLVCPLGASLDKEPPVTLINLAGTIGNNGWYVSDVMMTLIATDGGGTCGGGGMVAKTEYSFDGTNWNLYEGPVVLTGEGQITVNYKSTDSAGNIEETKSEIVKIDKTAPEINILVPQEGGIYPLNSETIVNWTAGDNISGIFLSSATLPAGAALDTTSTGEKNFSVLAEDKAGNKASKNIIYYVNYIFDFGGFLPPIKNDGSGVYKFRNDIPVKFRLTDTQGNFVTTVTAKLYLAKIEKGVVGPEIKAVSSGGANVDNLFRYDSKDNLYTFNLSTAKLSTGLWRLKVTINEVSSKAVNITFK